MLGNLFNIFSNNLQYGRIGFKVFKRETELGRLKMNIYPIEIQIFLEKEWRQADKNWAYSIFFSKMNYAKQEYIF